MTAVYGAISDRLLGQFVYGLSTSNGMIALIVAMVGGVLTTVVAMLFGVVGGASIWIGVAGGLIVLAGLSAFTASQHPARTGPNPGSLPDPQRRPRHRSQIA